MNKNFIYGFEKRAIELGINKTSGIINAIGAHAAQNKIMKKLLSSESFGNNLAKEFRDGLHGKSVSKVRDFGRGLIGGVIPEYTALQQHSRRLGEELSKTLNEHGVNKMLPKHLNVARKAFDGKFSEFSKHYNEQDPVHRAIFSHVKKKIGQEISIHDLPKFEKVWKSKDSPLTSNVVSRFFRPSNIKDLRNNITHIPGGTDNPRINAAGAFTSSALMAPIDPLTAGMNMSKTVMLNPAITEKINKTRVGKKALTKLDEEFVHKPIRNSFESSRNNNAIRSKLRKFIDDYAFNSTVSSAQNTAELSGRSIHNESSLYRKKFLSTNLKTNKNQNATTYGKTPSQISRGNTVSASNNINNLNLKNNISYNSRPTNDHLSPFIGR